MTEKHAKLDQTETPLTLDVLLGHSCANPVDWEDYQKHQDLFHKWINLLPEDREGDMPIYRGWQRMDVTLHCTAWEIIARRKEDGSYEVREYHIQDH